MNKRVFKWMPCCLVFPVAQFFSGAVCLAQFKEADAAVRMDSLISALHDRKQFSGEILVSKSGKMIYDRTYGEADVINNTPFSTSTPCYLASLSKQFTAAGILILVEKNLIAL